MCIYVHRSSVRLVCGTRLNTRRSPSVMRLVSTSWRWPGTAETRVMRWRRHRNLTGDPMAGSSVLQTATTTSSRVEAVLWIVNAVGGMDHAAQAISTRALMEDGWQIRAIQPWTCKLVTCWWNSTNNYQLMYLHVEHYRHCCNLHTRYCNERFSNAEHLTLQAVVALCVLIHRVTICCRCSMWPRVAV